MTLLALAMAGAALGAPARWLLDQYVQDRHRSAFPWGTLLINVLGSFVFGALISLSSVGEASAAAIALLGAGLCGGFTTFSTFSYETYRLTEDAAYRIGGMNVAASVTVGLLASFAGWWLADAVLG